MALPQVIPKGCMLQLPPRKAPFLDLLRRGGSLLLEKGRDTASHPDCAASQGLFCHLTGKVVLIVHEIVDSSKVPGQVKHGPLDNHNLVPNLGPCGHHIEGAKGGNSDPLRVEEKGRAEG